MNVNEGMNLSKDRFLLLEFNLYVFDMERFTIYWEIHQLISFSVWSDLTDKIKRIFFSSSGHVDTAIWMHHMDANKPYGEKTSRKLQKNCPSCIEQIQEATSHKTTAVRPPLTHHEIYLS